MAPPDLSNLDDAYRYNRGACVGFAVFGLVLVAASVAVVILGGDQMFISGLVPGWLFGSLSAAMFSLVSLSWFRRLAHSGPALVLSDSGITSHMFDGAIRWDEIKSAYPGGHGLVVLDLRSGETFLARQSLTFRLLQWHPSPRRRGTAIVGNVALDTRRSDLLADIEARLDRARLEGGASRLLDSDVTPQEEESGA